MRSARGDGDRRARGLVGVVELAVDDAERVGVLGRGQKILVARALTVEERGGELAHRVAGAPRRRLDGVGDEVEVLRPALLQRDVVLLVVVVRDAAIDPEELVARREVGGGEAARIERTEADVRVTVVEEHVAVLDRVLVRLLVALGAEVERSSGWRRRGRPRCRSSR